MAGGTDPKNKGPGDAVFLSIPSAKMGDNGSQVLKAGPPMANWTAGESVEVSWAIRYNHGGGCE